MGNQGVLYFASVELHALQLELNYWGSRILNLPVLHTLQTVPGVSEQEVSRLMDISTFC